MNWAGINWDAVLAVAQIVGDLGVFLSLVYVAIQIRDDAKARRSQTMHQLAAEASANSRSIAEHADLAEIWSRGRQGIKSLGPIELVRFNYTLTASFRIFEDAFLQNRLGHFETSVWRGVEAPLERLLSQAGIREYWQLGFSEAFSAEFRAFVNAKIETTHVERPRGQVEPASSTVDAESAPQ